MTELVKPSSSAVAWRAQYTVPGWFMLCFVNELETSIHVALSTMDSEGNASLYCVTLQPGAPVIYMFEKHPYWTHRADVIRNDRSFPHASFGFSLETGRVILLERGEHSEIKSVRRSSPIRRVYLGGFE